MSFGHEFGKLIKRYRGMEGMSQKDLAIRAFGNEDAKSRISELENGHRSAPHASTVDLLTVALNISSKEVDDLYEKAERPIIYGSLLDFFYKNPKNDSIDIEISVDTKKGRNTDSKLFIYHNTPVKVDNIIRVEFFVEDRDLVFLDAKGWRRNIGMMINEKMEEYVVKLDKAQFIFIQNSEKNLLDGNIVPLKIIY